MMQRTRRNRRPSADPRLAVAYLRASTDDQRLSPEAQRAAIEAWAKRAGVTVVAWHHDHGVSGAAAPAERPELLAALADLQAHAAGVLVVAKRDRLARDVMHVAMIERMVAGSGASIVSAAGEGTDADPSDPTGLLLRRMVDAFAEYERAIIAARTRAALAAKAARGEVSGPVPYGKRVAGGAAPAREADGRRAVRRLEPDAHEQAMVDRARALVATGLSLRAAAARLAAEGFVGRTGHTLQASTIARWCAANVDATV
jgi:DNA invertase Pin-like site-specific DNA recombinase